MKFWQTRTVGPSTLRSEHITLEMEKRRPKSKDSSFRIMGLEEEMEALT